jgi:hypothetical protein
VQYSGGGMSVATSPSSGTIGYNQNLSIRNNYEGDENLMFSRVIATVEANDKIIFNEQYNKGYNDIINQPHFGKLSYSNINEAGTYAEEININIINDSSSDFNRDFKLEDGTKLKVTIKVEDNLGLTYEYAENFTITAEHGSIYEEIVKKQKHSFMLLFFL